MPIYDYKCSTCGKEFEYQQRITDEPLISCPEDICELNDKGLGEVQRVLSRNVGLVFKGSGFYLTDYVKKKSE
jgi:putative FmdB family regulatory protein